MSQLVYSFVWFHAVASVLWLAICGFGAFQVVTQRVQQRLAGSTVSPQLP